PSTGGGNISLSGSSMSLSGANVRFVSYADSVTGNSGGQIQSGSTNVSATGNFVGLAGASSGTAINMSNVAGQSIVLSTTQPAFTSGSNVTFNANGTIISNNSWATNSPTLSSAVNTGNLTSSGGAIKLSAGGSITTG